MKMLRDQLFWLIALFVALIFWLPYSQPLFAALFPQLPRPVYQQESFAAGTGSFLAGGNFEFVCGDHWLVPEFRFRPLVETIAAVAPVECWRLPLVIGFGLKPAIIA